MQNLTAREVNELLIECGPTLAGAFVAKQLVDELVLYVAPTVLGDDALPLLRIKLGNGASPVFDFRDAQRFGDDMRLILKLKKH
jgi:diaminohydroxyphosphoribosylaminopyrimidine deaminase/5-amino-6-(5-phosphoribosylamino)uracil reductase